MAHNKITFDTNAADWKWQLYDIQCQCCLAKHGKSSTKCDGCDECVAFNVAMALIRDEPKYQMFHVSTDNTFTLGFTGWTNAANSGSSAYPTGSTFVLKTR